MKRMVNLIMGFILIVMGYLMACGLFSQTNHYSVLVDVNKEVRHRLTFTTVDEPFTIDLLKKKFNFDSNDEVIILDVKSITQREKDEALKKLKQGA